MFSQLSFQYQNLLCLRYMANAKKACVLKRKAFRTFPTWHVSER